MTGRLRIDIETRSRVDLKKTGVYRYARCPDFKILMAAWSRDGETIQTALDWAEIDCIPGLWDESVVKVAHNAQFERICFSRFAGYDVGEYLSPDSWHDTQAVAGELGYPQSLLRLGQALGGEQKDEAGSHLINLFCKPNRAGGWNDETTHPLQWLDFVTYCEQDVATLIDVDRKLGDFPTEMEHRVFLADQYVNDAGLAIDVSMAREAVRVGEVNEDSQMARAREITGLDNPNSVQQMGRWLDEMGCGLPDLRAETVERALGTDLPDSVREALELRQELALAAPAKFASALASHTGGRLRGNLKFFGAHTGRWAGRGTQPHNLPRSSFDNEVDTELAIYEIMEGGLVPAQDLKRLVRPLFILNGTVVDYAAIEARVIAWLAGEEWALQAFREGRDIYVETAKQMGPQYTRAQGKIAVLALGFNGGPGSLRAMADPGSDIRTAQDDVLYEQFVYPWRNTNSQIVKLWKTLDSRFRTGGPVGDHLTIEKDGNDRYLRLPSGRAICYRKCGERKRMVLNPRTDKLEERRVLSFWSPMGYRVDTYGGRLAENVTQAVARDVMAEAIVRLLDRGFNVVGHVHDEILVEGSDDVETISKIITEPPAWADGLPIDGEGFTTRRYRKG